MKSEQNGPGLFGRMARDGRKASGLSQADLASRSGVSARALFDIEQGLGTVAALEPILAVLDIRITGLPRGPTLRDRVRLGRLKREITIEDMSRRTGLSKGSIRRLEEGNARIATLERVLDVIAPNAVRVRRRETSAWQSGGVHRDQRFTPDDFVEKLIGVMGSIDLDPCGHPNAPASKRASRFFTEADDGLRQPWNATTAFVNPPYSIAAAFLRKAHDEWRAGNANLIVMLMPVRTHGPTFFDYAAPVADVLFLRDRVKFVLPDRDDGVTAPFGNKFIVYGGGDAVIDGLKREFPSVHLRPG